MSIQISGALRDSLLVSGSLRSAINGFYIRIYNGTPPTLPEDSVAGNVLLCTITNNGSATGLTFETSVTDGMLTKTASEVWSGTCGATGTATFYRLVSSSDTGLSSSSAIRVQGSVGVAGADLNVTSASFVTDDIKRIDYYAIGMLTS
jgi:hypothetical protein